MRCRSFLPAGEVGAGRELLAGERYRSVQKRLADTHRRPVAAHVSGSQRLLGVFGRRTAGKLVGVPRDWSEYDRSGYEPYDRENRQHDRDNRRRLVAQNNQRHVLRWWRWYLAAGASALAVDVVLIIHGVAD